MVEPIVVERVEAKSITSDHWQKVTLIYLSIGV